jgi:nucleoside-diphosphate-sugar epimerase
MATNKKRTAKPTLLIVGCGDIAFRAAALLGTRYRLLGLCRRSENRALLRSHGIIPVAGDLDRRQSLGKLAGISHAVLHLAPPPAHGKRDARMANLLAALMARRAPAAPANAKAAMLPHQLVYISTSGVYGDCNGALIEETRQTNPQTDRALRRADAERRLRGWGRRNGVKISIFRVPGIYACDRIPLERVRAGTPALLPEVDSYTNHIHADDLARILDAALHRALPGRVYHACDDSELKMGEYFDLIADKFGLPHPPRVTRAQAEECISPSLLSFMRESRRLANRRMKHELQVKLRYPTVEDGIAECAAIGTESG